MERASGIGSAETANSERCVWAGGGQVVSVGKGPVGGTWKFLFLGSPGWVFRDEVSGEAGEPDLLGKNAPNLQTLSPWRLCRAGPFSIGWESYLLYIIEVESEVVAWEGTWAVSFKCAFKPQVLPIFLHMFPELSAHPSSVCLVRY